MPGPTTIAGLKRCGDAGRQGAAKRWTKQKAAEAGYVAPGAPEPVTVAVGVVPAQVVPGVPSKPTRLKPSDLDAIVGRLRAGETEDIIAAAYSLILVDFYREFKQLYGVTWPAYRDDILKTLTNRQRATPDAETKPEADDVPISKDEFIRFIKAQILYDVTGDYARAALDAAAIRLASPEGESLMPVEDV
jgi:hypothetical protein